MENKKSDKIKNLIKVFGLFFLIIILIVFFILITRKKTPAENQAKNEISQNEILDNTTNNTIKNESTNNTSNANSTNNATNSTSNTNDFTEIEKKYDEIQKSLKKVTDMKTYFLMNNLLSKYYKSNDFESPTDIIGKEAIQDLGLTTENYSKFNNFDAPIFRIDEIYEQRFGGGEYIYVVKHKYGKSNLDAKDGVIWVRKDNYNKLFCIYPYEYLKMKNYTGFGEGDRIPVFFEESIKENIENTYEDITTVDTEMCMKGLFERYKFDLLADEIHLYNSINEEYKNIKFPSIAELTNYIKNNKNSLYLDYLSGYKTERHSGYVEYNAICGSKKTIIFNVTNMMDYNICLDEYTIVQDKEEYNSYLSEGQGTACLNRVLLALNANDYDFLYEKLSAVQKSNTYGNINDFIDFINKCKYDESIFEVDTNYLIVSDNVYQFYIKVTDASKKDGSYKQLTIAIRLEENSDFTMSIASGKY